MLFEASLLPSVPAAPAAKPNGGFLTGVTDLFGSILDRAPALAQTYAQIEAAKASQNASAAASKVAGSAYDAYGRLPGQPGYGSQTPPPGYVGAAPSMFPAWAKPVGIAAAALLGLFLVMRFGRK